MCVNKCSTFGIKKNGNSSTQFKSNLKLNNEVIPPVKLNETFTYLGKNIFVYNECRQGKIRVNIRF